ncbi:SCO family protein [Alkalimonas sp. MEB108]|uniref:SCO family protein n=1 Tax=Alkalimonas cellulosilytica TaxID=3058395 RepID=A0ABU7J6Y3_9GAMM|nr:SCO family protein [Alkalimonas sp. MEB108]MEE2002217.1 SCO family protein [Alkalimonas sp. MEB108]
MANKILFPLIAVLALVAGFVGYHFLQPSHTPEHTLLYPQPRVLADFQLTSHTGSAVTREQLYGQWTLAFVGYTYCPDICPLTLAQLAGLHDELQQHVPEPLNIWFVSVDPNRDTPQQMASYVQYFQQAAITGVTAGHDQLFPFVRQLGLMYAMSSTTDEHYLVDHSASIVLINPKGQLVAMFKPELVEGRVPTVRSEDLLADFPWVIRQLARS